MNQTYDVLIAGSGVAGLYAALSLDRRLRVLVLAKGDLTLCNTALAQGGIAAVLRDDDRKEDHFRDTMIAGGHRNNPGAVHVLVDEGPDDVRNLIRLGVEFDRDSLGALHMTLEGGHSRNRIVHHKDNTGYEVAVTLIAQAQARENIELLDHAVLLGLEHDERGFYAGVERGGALYNVSAAFCILATGGIGRAYQYTTNSKIATGDGICFAQKLGAPIRDLSLIQFHPTAFAAQAERERFLISESVRGEGARLLNCRGERFMTRYDKRGELAPRDVVSHSIILESRRLHSEKFYLDITAEDPDFVRARFPSIYKNCLEEGVDITKDRIPVFPCQHYLMGGIDVDLYARTGVEGLYAAGECSRTGVHGNNRLASNSLLEALVFSRRAAQDISAKSVVRPPARSFFKKSAGAEPPQGVRSEIRAILQRGYFVIPDRETVARSLPEVRAARERLAKGGYALCSEFLEITSIAHIAEMVLAEAEAVYRAGGAPGAGSFAPPETAKGEQSR